MKRLKSWKEGTGSPTRESCPRTQSSLLDRKVRSVQNGAMKIDRGVGREPEVLSFST